jgi:hypothetical protein
MHAQAYQTACSPLQHIRGRNILIGPGGFDTDLAVLKHFRPWPAERLAPSSSGPKRTICSISSTWGSH